MENLKSYFKTIILLAFLLIPLKGQTQYINRKAKSLPEIMFVNLEGQEFNNNHLAENAKLIIFYLDPSCNICQKEMETILNNLDQLKNTQIVLVSPHSISQLIKFYEKFELENFENIVLLQDKNDHFYKQFKVNSYPALFLYNEKKEQIGEFDTYADFQEIMNEFAAARR